MNLTSLIPYSEQISYKLGLSAFFLGVAGGYRKVVLKRLLNMLFRKQNSVTKPNSKRRKLANKT